jgi:hypothetical protein
MGSSFGVAIPTREQRIFWASRPLACRLFGLTAVIIHELDISEFKGS